MKAKNLTFLVATLLLVVSVFLPYILIIFTSPQYPTKSPRMYLYLYSLKGDLRDWEVVGRYIGVNVHPTLPEFDYKIVVAIVLLVALLSLIAFFKGVRWQKTVSVIMLIVGFALAVWAQYRLYQQGHNLDPKAPLRYVVKSFTPPLIGLTKVSKIRIYHLPHIGFLLYALSCFLTLYSSWFSKPKTT